MKKLILLAIASLSLFSSGWETKYNENGLKVEINLDGAIKQRSSVVVNASLEDCIAMQKDPKQYKKFIYSYKDVSVLEQPDSDHLTVELTTTMPWPLDDKASIIKKTFHYDAAQQSFEIVSRTVDKGDNTEGKYTDSKWTFKALSENKVAINMESTSYKMDVPKFIVGLFIADYPQWTLEHFKQEVEK